MHRIQSRIVLFLFCLDFPVAASEPARLEAESHESLIGSALSVLRYDTAEIVFHAKQPYDGATGTPNPFTSVTLTLSVTSPTAKHYTVDGFFDGDGAGGAMGDVFKARIFADEPGTWTWTATSTDNLMDGLSGSFSCAGTLPGTFSQGPIVVDPLRPRYFAHADGTTVYLIGKYLDNAIGGLRTKTHPMLSEFWTETDRRDVLDRQLDLQVKKINVYVANKLDYPDYGSTTPWVGTWDLNDKTRFDLARWTMYDLWIRTMRDEGVVADLWLFADNSEFGDLPEADRKLLIRYAMARLSGYVNTLFVLASEWQEGWSTTEVNVHADYFQSWNPWRRLFSTHGRRGDFSFPNAAWATFMNLQTGNHDPHGVIHAYGLSSRALAAKPIINDEYWNGNENLTGRQKLWAAFTAGAAGSGTGAFLPQLLAYTQKVPFQDMQPMDPLVVSGGAYGLAQAGTHYVFYLYGGGTVGVDLSLAPAVLDTRWYDPRTGAFSDVADVQGGGVVSLTAPDNQDWVLDLRAGCVPTEGVAPVFGLRVGGDKKTLTWTPESLAVSYDVVKGDLDALIDSGGDFTSTVTSCLGNDLAAAQTLDDGPNPAVYEGFYYLVRVAALCGGGAGTYDGGGTRQLAARDAQIAASALACP